MRLVNWASLMLGIVRDAKLIGCVDYVVIFLFCLLGVNGWRSHMLSLYLFLFGLFMFLQFSCLCYERFHV